MPAVELAMELRLLAAINGLEVLPTITNNDDPQVQMAIVALASSGRSER